MLKPNLWTIRRCGLVALAFLHIAVTRGLHGTFGVFYVALLEAFGWSRGATAGAISLLIVSEGLAFPFAGSLTDRLGPRRTLILGGSALALGLGLSATVSSIWELYLWMGILTALGLSLIGMVPHVAILSREFSQYRGRALGLAWSGGGLGILLLVPFAQIMINNWGWSWAYVGLAAVTATVVIPPVLVLFGREGPARPERPGGRNSDPAEWTVRQALRNSTFWLLFASRVLASIGNQIVITHQIAHAVDMGYPKLFAASIFGLMGVVSVFGRFLFGYLTDIIKGETVFMWVQLVSLVGILSLLALHDNSSPWLLYTYALFYGLGQGSRALVLSTISADLFLGTSFGAIYGYFTLSVGLGGGFGAWLGGFVHDVTESYSAAFLLAMFCAVVSTIGVWLSKVAAKAR
ncbi:MAG: MFS transporter [Deltaproteobacteria bacterium]|nr:MFS transporter [Deltaproteobacteria bacterium]